jgi:hypothetical protein
MPRGLRATFVPQRRAGPVMGARSRSSWGSSRKLLLGRWRARPDRRQLVDGAVEVQDKAWGGRFLATTRTDIGRGTWLPPDQDRIPFRR